MARAGARGRAPSPDVAVLAKELDLAAELLAELGEERLHLVADGRLEDVAVGGEVLPAVVGLQALEPPLHLGPEAIEGGHAADRSSPAAGP
jgi:hypothetical protein